MRRLPLNALVSTVMKEFRVLKRNKSKVGLVVLSPLMFWCGFALLMGGVYAEGIEAGLVVLETEPGYYTQGLIDILSAHDEIPPSLVLIPLDEPIAQSMFDEGSIMLVIVIPTDFEDMLSSNQSTSVDIWVNNMHEDMTKNLRMSVIRKIDLYYQTYLPDDAVVDFEFTLLREETYPRLGYMAWTMSIYAVMFGAMYGASSSLTKEFEEATWDESQLSGQSLHAVYCGKMLVGASIGFIAPIVLLLIGLLGYGVWPSGNIIVYLAIAVPLAIISAGIGIVLGAFARSSVYVVPLAALSSLFYWIMGGGMAPLLLAGLSFDAIDSYSPFSNAYRSLTNMFVDGIYTTLAADLLLLWTVTIAVLVIAPMASDRLSKVEYSRIRVHRRM
jgi:hypothetical protein